MKKGFLTRVFSFSLAAAIIFSPLSSYAMEADMTAQKLLPIQSNEINNWPVGPSVSAYSALLMDADTGVILYEKNAYEKMYPASTTKLLTCLLAMEKEDANLNDLVSFSYDAVMTVPWDASKMGMDVGEKMTLEECLYGILVVSANEVSNAVAEYVSGDIDTFVKLMNNRAKELGCTATNFTNAHGYTDEDHYTTAYDLTLIAKEFFKNELLSKICRSTEYHWYPTEYQPDDMYLGSTNYFLKGRKFCEGLIGSKTGYTDESRNVLVTCAERNGMKLIAVVMMEETPYQYDDTNTLLDYGFSNFEKIKVSEYEKKYIVTDETFFHSDSAVFGDCSSVISLDSNATVILPKTLTFNELSSSLSLNTNESNDNLIATVNYSYDNVFLGKANIYFSKKNDTAFVFDETNPEIDDSKESEEETVFIYINYIIYGVVALFILILLITLIRKILSNYHFAERRKAAMRWKKRKKYEPGPSYRATKKNKKRKSKKWKKKDLYYFDL